MSTLCHAHMRSQQESQDLSPQGWMPKLDSTWKRPLRLPSLSYSWQEKLNLSGNYTLMYLFKNILISNSPFPQLHLSLHRRWHHNPENSKGETPERVSAGFPQGRTPQHRLSSAAGERENTRHMLLRQSGGTLQCHAPAKDSPTLFWKLKQFQMVLLLPLKKKAAARKGLNHHF